MGCHPSLTLPHKNCIYMATHKTLNTCKLFTINLLKHMCVCMYVCMYVYIYVYTHTRAHAHAHTYTHLQYSFEYLLKDLDIYLNIKVILNLYTYFNTCISIYSHTLHISQRDWHTHNTRGVWSLALVKLSSQKSKTWQRNIYFRSTI